MRVGYLGPPGTFSEEALERSAASAGVTPAQPIAFPTIREVVLAAAQGNVERAIVPMENSLEGSVNESVDALVRDAPGISIVAETVLPVRYSLVAAAGLSLADISVVLSHPQALGQCSRFLGEHLPQARTQATTSTAEAVRAALASPEPACALATALAARLYGGTVVRQGVEDDPSNVTRFVWLAASGTEAAPAAGGGTWKSTVVFAGAGDSTPGWLVGCLSEFAARGVNLSRIESRPEKRRLGHYLFLVDVAGRADEKGAPAAEALAALRAHCEDVRLLGSYPAADTPGG